MCVHSNDVCETCDMVYKRKVGGRPKRKQNIAGCPKAIMEHLYVQYWGQNANVQSPSQQSVLPHYDWMIWCVEAVVTS